MNKKYKNSVLWSFWLLLIIFLSSCETKKEYDLLTGQLYGYVSLFDTTNDLSPISDLSGVEIIAEGSDPEISVFSEEDGSFIFNDLPAGTYNYIFKKDGYGTYKYVGETFVGGSEPSYLLKVYLYQLYNSTIEIDEIDTTQNSYNYYTISINGSISTNSSSYNENENFRYYISNNENVSYSDYLSTGEAYFSYDNSIYGEFTMDTLLYPVGTEMYFIMYSSSDYNYYYIDTETGNKIYSGVNTEKPSNVVKAIVPQPKTYSW